MSVRSGAGGAFFRVSSCETYDSVTRAARARSRCSKPSSSNRSRITNATSTNRTPSRSTILTDMIKLMTQHNSSLDKYSKPATLHHSEVFSRCEAHIGVVEESSHVRTQRHAAPEGQLCPRVHPEARNGHPAGDAQAERLQGRDHVRHGERKGSAGHQLVGEKGERGGLQPRHLSHRAAEPREGRRWHASSRGLRGLQLDVPQDSVEELGRRTLSRSLGAAPGRPSSF